MVKKPSTYLLLQNFFQFYEKKMIKKSFWESNYLAKAKMTVNSPIFTSPKNRKDILWTTN